MDLVFIDVFVVDAYKRYDIPRAPAARGQRKRGRGRERLECRIQARCGLGHNAFSEFSTTRVKRVTRQRRRQQRRQPCPTLKEEIAKLKAELELRITQAEALESKLQSLQAEKNAEIELLKSSAEKSRKETRGSTRLSSSCFHLSEALSSTFRPLEKGVSVYAHPPRVTSLT